jgi:serine/threonine-protein kinase
MESLSRTDCMMIVDRALLEEALPGYELGEELGRGASGLVIGARHRRLGRPVALKVLAATSDRQGQLEERFLAEAQVLSELDHPHIVRLYDYVEHRGLCLLVMEWLGGGSLGARSLTQVAPEYACGFGLAVGDALHAAHQRRVLHRDVKPDNLLFAADGTVKVTDFGIAKLFEGSAAAASSFIGSPTYMAPEQASLGRLGPGTDLYSLSVVLYQLFTGRPLFSRELPPAAMLLQHINQPPPPMTDVPPEIASVVLRALSKDIGDRQATARVFALDLATAAAHSFGAGWLARARMPLRIDDELRDAARSLGPPDRITERRPGIRQPLRPPPPPSPPPPAEPSRPPADSEQDSQPSTVVPVSQILPALSPPPRRTGPLVVPATPAWLISPQSGRPRRRARSRRRWLAAGLSLLVVAGSIVAGFGIHAVVTRAPARLEAAAVAAVGDTVYVADPAHDQVKRLNARTLGATSATVVAGNGHRGFSGDGGPAVDAQLSDPGALAVDTAGNLYIADLGNSRVRKVGTDGRISTVAGGGRGELGNASQGDQAALLAPFSIAVSGRGTLWIAERRRNRVSQVATNGQTEVVAGTGQAGFAGDGKAAKKAMLNGPTAIAVDKDEKWLYIADADNRRVRSVRMGAGVIQTFAGNGVDGPLRNNMAAKTVSLKGAYALAVGPDGTVYIGGDDLRKVTRAGFIAPAASPTTTSVAVTGAGELFGVASERGDSGEPVHRLYLLKANGQFSRVGW